MRLPRREPASGNVLHIGRSQPGGRITGRLVFADGVQARLEVDAQLAGGGVYQGSVVVS